MISFSEFFEINSQIIIFSYGLAFFILGLAVIVRIRPSSRLELVRSLKWLAAFGIMHGLNEWGDLFIPLQASYLSPFFMRGLYLAQLFLLTLSFAALFEFGVSILNSIGQMKYLQGVSVFLSLSWTIAIIFLFLTERSSHQEWRYISMALSRYFIGFPGSLLAAYGLRAYTKKRVAPLSDPTITRTFQMAGYSIAIYAILSGLIPPPVPFFPGNLLNTESFTQFTGAPPWVYRTAVALVITITIIRALEIFELETNQRIEKLEQEKIIAAERERYARELHDGTIQKVYTAGLLVESAFHIADPQEEISKRLNRAAAILNDTIADLRQSLIELNVHTSTETKSLAALIQQVVNTPHYNSLVDVQLDLQLPSSKELSPRRANHISAILTEALSNIVRHAKAQKVIITAKDLSKNFLISIKDDGIGLPEDLNVGYGLRNMRDRTRILNGKINCSNEEGTIITLSIPWVDENL